MTLSTDVLILDPVDRNELYQFCNNLVVETSEIESRKHETYNKTSASEIRNQPDQGYSAWLTVNANADGTSFEPDPEHDDYCGEGCDSWRCTQPYFARINFDTAYWYQGPLNETCSMLHAQYILKISAWAAERDIRVKWVNEYEGAVHEDSDVEALKDFIDDGDSANRWFADVLSMINTLGYEFK
jgi:hypothetical protein